MSSFCSCSERVETDSAKLELTLSMLDLRIPLSSLACALAEIMDSNSSRRSLLFALTALSASSINVKVVIYTIICKNTPKTHASAAGQLFLVLIVLLVCLWFARVAFTGGGGGIKTARPDQDRLGRPPDASSAARFRRCNPTKSRPDQLMRERRGRAEAGGYFSSSEKSQSP